MADPVAAALLVVLAAAYVGGVVLVVTGLGKILLTWWAVWRARTDAVVVDDALRAKATAAMNTAAAAAGLAPPRPTPWRSWVHPLAPASPTRSVPAD